MLLSHQDGQPVDRLSPVTSMEQIAGIQEEIRDIFMSDPVLNYLLDIVRQTREHPLVLLGASPRASLSFMMACKAYAFLQGRDYVLPDDVKILTPFALGHRILLRPESRLDNISVESLLQKLLQSIHVPVTMRQ